MGNKTSSIFIKLDNPSDYDIRQMAEKLYPGYKSIRQQEPWQSKFRHQIGIIKHVDGIEIEDWANCSAIIEEQNTNSIQKIYNYFDKPVIIVAYLSIDFNGACGIAIIENGELTRCRYYIPEEDNIRSDDIGQHLSVENECYDKLRDNPNFDFDKRMISNLLWPSNEMVQHHYVDNSLICALMNELLGFDLWTTKERIPYQIELDQSIWKYVSKE